MFFEEIFGPWGSFVLIGISVATILLTLILGICFLAPGCLGYKCIIRSKREEKRSINQQQTEQQNENENIKLSNVSYRSWRLSSLYENNSINENGELPLRDPLNFHYNEFDPQKMSSNLNLIEIEKKKTIKKKSQFPTEITLSLQFLPNIDESKTSYGKFIIGVEALSGLPPKQYNCTIEPYVIVNIFKMSWSHRRRKKILHSFKTRGVRHTANPIYRETFIITDVDIHEAKDWILDICAHDYDRYANHTELASVKIPMKEVKKIFISPEIHMFNYNMKLSDQEFGKILLGISYLPTAERLTIAVIRLRDLKNFGFNSLKDFNPYIKILMLNGKTGRKIKKKKTKVLNMASPTLLEFNETLTFDISFSQLDTVQFLAILCNKIIINTTPQMIEYASDSEESIQSSSKPKDISVSKVALGKGVRGTTERLHWFSVLQNPRKLVSVWHTLK